LQNSKIKRFDKKYHQNKYQGYRISDGFEVVGHPFDAFVGEERDGLVRWVGNWESFL